MRPWLPWALLAVGAAVVLLTLPSIPGAARPSPTRPAAAASAGPRTADVTKLPQVPLRNIFEYPDQRTVNADAVPWAESAASPPPALLPSPAPTIRLVGLVKRGEVLCAALWIAGEIVVLAPGEAAEGYHLLGVGEDEGVRLRTPSGEELTLPPAE